MITILSPHKDHPNIEPASSEADQESIHPYQFDVNITDGGEFLDDGIRMHDQPLSETTVKEDE